MLSRTLHRVCPLVLHRQEFWGRMNEAASTALAVGAWLVDPSLPRGAHLQADRLE